MEDVPSFFFGDIDDIKSYVEPTVEEIKTKYKTPLDHHKALINKLDLIFKREVEICDKVLESND